MTLDAWLQARVPAPPPALVRRMREALDGMPASPDDAAHAETLLDAGEQLLRGLLGADHLTRNGAVDLLTADALVTYAFEAAAAEPERIQERARVAMTRLAALATEEAR